MLHTYSEVNERWHRMDALNAGLEKAVNSKATLQASVESAELLLIKQVGISNWIWYVDLCTKVLVT